MADAIQATMTNTLLSGWSVLKPNKMKDLFRAYENQGADYLLMIKALGWQREVDQETYSHWEEDRIHTNFQSKGNVTGQVAGATVAITLHADSVDANNRYYPRVGDNLLFGNGSGRVVGTVISINETDPTAPILSVRPNQVGDTIPDIATGDYLFIYSNAHGEGSDQVDPRISGVTEYSNYLKIIKEDVKTTGTAMTDRLWFDIPWAKMDGRAPAGSYYRKALVDLDYRMGVFIGGALQFDEPVTNTLIVDAVYGTTRQATFGLFPAANLYGYTDDYTPGTLTIGDFDVWGRALTRESVTNGEIMGLFGDDLYVEVENLLVDYLGNTNVDYTRKKVISRLFQGSASMEVVVGFSYFTKGSRTYMFKVNYDYSNVTTYGSTGYNYSHLGIFIPMGKSRDSKTSEMVGSIGYRYKKLGNYSREFKMWDTGSANMDRPTNTIDYKRTSCMAHIGAHQIAANRFITLEPQA